MKSAIFYVNLTNKYFLCILIFLHLPLRSNQFCPTVVYLCTKDKEVGMDAKVVQKHLVKVFNGNLWQAELVQGLLEANGIACMLKNDTLSAVTSPYTSIGGEVWVLVNDCDEEAALALIGENVLESNPFN